MSIQTRIWSYLLLEVDVFVLRNRTSISQLLKIIGFGNSNLNSNSTFNYKKSMPLMYLYHQVN